MRELRFRWVSCLCFAAMTAGCASEREPAVDLLSVAEKLTNAGKGVQAVKLLAGLAAETRDPRVLYRFALAQEAAGNLAGSAEALRRASELAPEHVLIRVQLATTLAVMGELDAARVQALKLIEMVPKNSGGPLLFAAVAGPAELAAAIGYLERWYEGADARRATLKAFEALVALQDLYRRSSDHEKAASLEQSIQRAVLANPPGALQLAQVYRHSERREVSAALLRAAGAADPGLPVWGTLAAIEADLGRLEEAEAALEKLPEAQRDLPRHELIRASILLSRNQPAKAAERLRTAQLRMAAPQRHGRVSLLLAQALARAGDLAGARAELESMKAAGRATTTATFLYADVLRRLGDHAAAAREVEPLLESADTREAAYGKLVTLHTIGGDLDAAANVCAAWLRERPGHPPALIGRARVELRRKQHGKAMATLRGLLDAHPGTVRALDILVATLRSQGNGVAAEKLIREQLGRAPTVGMLDFAGIYLENNGKPQEAEKLYRQMLSLDRGSAAGWARLARLMRSQERNVEAMSMYQQALKFAPVDLTLAIEAAPLEAEAGHLDRAIELYERVAASGVKDAGLMNNLADIYARKGENLTRALELATAARVQRPDASQILDTLGWIHHRRGNEQKALPLLRQAAAALPDRANVSYHLGVVEIASGESARGARSLRRALQLDPTLVEAERALASLATDGAGATPKSGTLD